MGLVQRLERLARSAGAAVPLHGAAAQRVPCGDRGCGHRVCEIARDFYEEGYADGLAAAGDK